MLKHAAEGANLFDGEQGKVFFVVTWLGEIGQLSPCPARWVRHYRITTTPFSGITFSVPNVTPFNFFVHAVGACE